MWFGGIRAFQEIVFEVNMNFEIVSHIQVSLFMVAPLYGRRFPTSVSATFYVFFSF